MAYKLGLDAKLFIGGAEAKNVKDVTLSLESGEADVTTRATEGWRAYAATLKEASLEFEMQWDTEDGSFSSIQSAYFGNSPLAIFVTDGEGRAELSFPGGGTLTLCCGNSMREFSLEPGRQSLSWQPGKKWGG